MLLRIESNFYSRCSFNIYTGRFLTSAYIFERYWPVTPIHKRISPPIKRIRKFVRAVSGKGFAKNAVSTI